MKKTLLIILTMILAIGICGCGEKATTPNVPSYMSAETYDHAYKILCYMSELVDGDQSLDSEFPQLIMDELNEIRALDPPEDQEEAKYTIEGYVVAFGAHYGSGNLHDGEYNAEYYKDALCEYLGSPKIVDIE